MTLARADSAAAHPRRAKRRRFLGLTLALLTIASSAVPENVPSQPKTSEYQIKAAYLLSFAKFVKWPVDSPATRGSDFEICVLGEDPFGGNLDAAVSGKKLDGLPVAVRRLIDVAESKTCRVIFISKSEDAHLAALLVALGPSESLTVSDIPRFSQLGGMIEFVPEGSRVRFGINLDSARHSRLHVSSQLLKIATQVISSHRSGQP
jgi:hypothetical protein